MTLGNMRANGVRSLDVSCWQCHHRTILSADPWTDHVPGADVPAAHGVHLMRHRRRRRGTVVGIIGETGAGKETKPG
jgi:ABC-type multidrug transport system fused ATPase/permease subunit